MSDELCPGCPGDPNENCCKPELRVKVWMDKQKTDEQRHIEAQAMQRLQVERLRDEFAMAAMREILAHDETRHIAGFGTGAFDEVAVGAYQIADAMLAARTQEPRHD